MAARQTRWLACLRAQIGTDMRLGMRLATDGLLTGEVEAAVLGRSCLACCVAGLPASAEWSRSLARWLESGYSWLVPISRQIHDAVVCKLSAAIKEI